MSKAKSSKTQILFSLVIQHAYTDTESQIHKHKRNKQESVQHFTIVRVYNSNGGNIDLKKREYPTK